MSIWHINLDFVPGTIIDDAIRDAIELANKYHCTVSFRFNGVVMDVSRGDDFKDVYMKWKNLLKMDVYRLDVEG